MVWAAIWGSQRSDLIVMEQDATAKKDGYSATSYLKVLDETMSTCWQPGMIFMQDNAPIHTAKRVVNWFELAGIPLLEWPPYSPDLNPIEHCWAFLKQWLVDNRPDLTHLGESQEAFDS